MTAVVMIANESMDPIINDIRCPACGAELAPEDLNMTEGVGRCQRCSTLTRLSELAVAESLAEVEVSRAPAGCTVRAFGGEAFLSASTRSIGGALGVLAFAAFWNGITGIFVAVAAVSTARHLGIPLPSSLESGAFSTMNGEPMSLGMTIFLWIFLLPFIAIGLLMAGTVLYFAFGSVHVRITADRVMVRSAIGPFGWWRTCPRDSVRTVRSVERRSVDSDGDRSSKRTIEIRGEPLLAFGGSLKHERRRWLAAATVSYLGLQAGPTFRRDRS
jgi:hypothetical protein